MEATNARRRLDEGGTMNVSSLSSTKSLKEVLLKNKTKKEFQFLMLSDEHQVDTVLILEQISLLFKVSGSVNHGSLI